MNCRAVLRTNQGQARNQNAKLYTCIEDIITFFYFSLYEYRKPRTNRKSKN